MATTSSEVEVTRRFLGAIADRDYTAMRACLADDARLRALVPTRLRDDEGADAVVARFRFWWDDIEDFRLIEAGADDIADRTHLRYRIGGRDEGVESVMEQHAYATVKDGRITALNLVCSGWRPV
jgi:ketosteroid isomerase-like protein